MTWSQPAARVHDHIRGLSPHPGAWFELPDGTRVRARRSIRVDSGGAPGTVLDERLSIACGEGVFRPLRLQRPGRTAQDAAALLRGFPVPPGTILPCPATG